MVATIGYNATAARVRLNLASVQTDLAKVTQRLSNGLRLPSDGPSNLAIGGIFESQARAWQVASNSLQSATSLLNVADAALDEIGDILSRLFELAVTANSGALTDADRAPLDTEFQALVTTVEDLVTGTQFNGKILLDGSAGTITIQTGPMPGNDTTIDLSNDFGTTGGVLQDLSALSIDTQANAATASGDLPDIESDFGAARATLGAAAQSVSSLAAVANQAQIESFSVRATFVEADIAAQTTQLVRDQLLLTAGASALQVANFSAASVVNLLSAVANRAASI